MKETEDDKKRQKRGGKGLSKPKKKEGGPKKISLSVAPRGRKRLTCVVGLKSYGNNDLTSFFDLLEQLCMFC